MYISVVSKPPCFISHTNFLIKKIKQLLAEQVSKSLFLVHFIYFPLLYLIAHCTMKKSKEAKPKYFVPLLQIK